MSGWTLPQLPERSGAYRWFYADVETDEVTAVFIFMVGAVFSGRYARAVQRGGRPTAHSAVNFALYRRGVRTHWVFTEYPHAVAEGQTLRIGDSSLTYGAGQLRLEVRDRTAPWGRAVQARLELTPSSTAMGDISLTPEGRHFWTPLALRAQARLEVPGQTNCLGGRAYHDSNHGETPLGSDVTGWTWNRIHGPQETSVRYQVDGAPVAINVRSADEATPVLWTEPGPGLDTSQRSKWGLSIPSVLHSGGRRFAVDRILESAPFYARFESRAGDAHLLGEVADFARFRSGVSQWMARLRTRVEARP